MRLTTKLISILLASGSFLGLLVTASFLGAPRRHTNLGQKPAKRGGRLNKNTNQTPTEAVAGRVCPSKWHVRQTRARPIAKAFDVTAAGSLETFGPSIVRC